MSRMPLWLAPVTALLLASALLPSCGIPSARNAAHLERTPAPSLPVETRAATNAERRAGRVELGFADAAEAGEDVRLPRPSSWTRVVARFRVGGASVAVFEAPSTADAAREDFVHQLEAAGYELGPVLAEDARGFWRGELRVTAVFAPLDGHTARVSIALLTLR